MRANALFSRDNCAADAVGGLCAWHPAHSPSAIASCSPYPALCFSFLSRIPSLETSLLNTRMPITMLTC